ncbi:hypothetical protein [Streptomyces sp. TRM68367]|uniref:hypothetical protein n=1 Tax=Streptomyces sp. TRM68367 TaxID=2758415 RepID=UPI00165C8F74|nr:hypothetical protein [Streptomyces sp. TRM68367]MBC9726526.1 hypothetical protein [Streptomyces sp. TRM68367]
MGSAVDGYRELERIVLGDSRAAVAELADIAPADLRKAEEHDVAVTLLLGALCERLNGGGSIAPLLHATAQRYVSSSFHYTGRILPRAEELVDLLDQAVDERSPELLIEVADHLSQGWSDYLNSIFPCAFARLAEELSLDLDTRDFSEVFVLWRRGLEAAVSNKPDEALPLFEGSTRPLPAVSLFRGCGLASYRPRHPICWPAGRMRPSLCWSGSGSTWRES